MTPADLRGFKARGVVQCLQLADATDDEAMTLVYQIGIEGNYGNQNQKRVVLEDVQRWRRRLHQPSHRPASGKSSLPPQAQELLLRMLSDLRGATSKQAVDDAADSLARVKSEVEAGAIIRSFATNSHEGHSRAVADLLKALSSRPARRRTRTSRKGFARGGDEGLRCLLRELYDGQCQVCHDTFMKKDGTPYSETHHIDRDVEGVARNLLVLCATCHRKMHYGQVSGLESILTAKTVTLCGEQFRVRVHEGHA